MSAPLEEDARRRPAFAHEGDVERAETLPGWVYGDPALHERLLEDVFARAWQPLPPGPQAVRPGRAEPFVWLEGSCSEPLLASRGPEGALHVLSNVCTHRGHEVLQGPTDSARLRCRYHGRSFGCDGRLVGAPGFEGACGFPGARDDLPRLRTQDWGPLTFCALPPAPSFAERHGPALARIAHLPSLAEAVFDPARSWSHEIEASWIAYVDNYLEGFHIPFVHGDLNAAVDWDAYRVEVLPSAVLQTALPRSGGQAFSEPDPHLGGRVSAAHYLWLWPNVMLNVYPWGLSLNVVEPLGPRRTRVVFRSYVRDAALLERGVGSGLSAVEREDEAVVESVQRAVRSRLYGRGRYAPRHELGVHAFHALLAARV